MAKKDLFEKIKEHMHLKTGLNEMERILWDAYGEKSAMLVLDATGFTKTVKDKGITHFLLCIVQLRERITAVFNNFSAKTIRAEADNLYAEFDSPTRALKAAVAANQTLDKNKIWLSPKNQLGICIGIGYGDVLRSKHQGVFGDEMNLASKLGEDTADGGEILLTLEAYQQLDKFYHPHFIKKTIHISGVQTDYFHANWYSLK